MENNPVFDFVIDEKLILVKAKADDNREIIKKLGALLFENGFVKSTYVAAVLEREKAYPTGLQARVSGVAVPHTDTIHVNRPAVAIATLDSSVIFNGMGAPDTEVDVNIVLMLAIHDPKEVVNVLRKIIFIIEDDQALQRILKARKKTEIKDILEEHIRVLSKKMGN